MLLQVTPDLSPWPAGAHADHRGGPQGHRSQFKGVPREAGPLHGHLAPEILLVQEHTAAPESSTTHSAVETEEEMWKEK